MKTLKINLNRDYSRLNTLINRKGVKHSQRSFNRTVLITSTLKYVFNLKDETLTISHFNWNKAKTIND